MNVRWTKICALVLALAVVPGVAEVVDSGLHLLLEGHGAHAQLDDSRQDGKPPADDHHEPGPEHGCSTTFHLCGCHASLTFLKPPHPPRPGLRLALFAPASTPVEVPSGFLPGIDRPPQA